MNFNIQEIKQCFVSEYLQIAIGIDIKNAYQNYFCFIQDYSDHIYFNIDDFVLSFFDKVKIDNNFLCYLKKYFLLSQYQYSEIFSLALKFKFYDISSKRYNTLLERNALKKQYEKVAADDSLSAETKKQNQKTILDQLQKLAKNVPQNILMQKFKFKQKDDFTKELQNKIKNTKQEEQKQKIKQLMSNEEQQDKIEYNQQIKIEKLSDNHSNSGVKISKQKQKLFIEDNIFDNNNIYSRLSNSDPSRSNSEICEQLIGNHHSDDSDNYLVYL